MLKLTIEEIKDLAELAGLEINKDKLPGEDEMDTVICIINDRDVLDEETVKVLRFKHVCYFDDIQDYEVYPLGKPIY